ncbi:MAG: hypothetical protein ACLR4Z_07045 [Butyricicoccaceae bacterium]
MVRGLCSTQRESNAFWGKTRRGQPKCARLHAGEHGDSEVAVWSSANISGADLDDFCLAAGIDDPESMLASLAREVTHAAYDIIERKGATCYGIAMAVRRIAEAIIRDEHAVLPVSTLARGAYGIEGVCLGLPAVVGRSGVSQVLDLPLSRDETERLLASAHKLKPSWRDEQGRRAKSSAALFMIFHYSPSG